MIIVQTLLVVLMVSFSKTKGSSKKPDVYSKKQLVVVGSHHKSRHPPEVVVVEHGGYDGSGDEKIDQETLSSLSNNVMATTNLLHSQSDFINNLGKNLELLENEAQEQKAKLSDAVANELQRYSELKDNQQNITKLVNALVVMWTQSEKNYVKIIRDIKQKVELVENGFSAQVKETIDKRFKAIEDRLYIIQTGSENARRLAASKRSRWPHGHYCILANGSCPMGFDRSYGYLRGIYVYGNTETYVKSARAGSSFIGCYNKNCGGYNNFASLNIVTCCK